MARAQTPNSRNVDKELRRSLTLVVALVVGGGAFGAPALAAEVTRVLSAAEPGNPIDINLGLDYRYEGKSAAIKRELQSSLSPGRTEIVKDLLYAQTRHLLDIHADIGVYRD